MDFIDNFDANVIIQDKSRNHLETQLPARHQLPRTYRPKSKAKSVASYNIIHGFKGKQG